MASCQTSARRARDLLQSISRFNGNLLSRWFVVEGDQHWKALRNSLNEKRRVVLSAVRSDRWPV